MNDNNFSFRTGARHARESAVRFLVVLAIAIGLNPGASAAEAPDDGISATREVREPHSLGHRLLFYVPNRLLDVLDVFRLRGRIGPGLAVDVRATDYLSFYAGSYSSVYLGLPGPRHPETWRSPVGIEEWRGIYFLGVDATDDTAEGPGYSEAEVNLGAQVLMVGIDLGFEPVEFGDFLAGLILQDPVGDDL